ncbi:MAG: peptide chain release factor N(5)-glutamine methyltransferase [Patescibacteria group bacterium]|nr:peptide chain release factor N(5)-glutamine methyltransferase [Patescibacteria group bacterium]
MKVKQAIKKLRKETAGLLPNQDSSVMSIMEYVLEINEAGVFKYLNKDLTPKHTKKLNKTITMLKKHVPLEHITSTAFFYGHRFSVSKDTLIPRPETETLVEQAILKIHEKLFCDKEFCDDEGNTKNYLNIIDVGTGSGCIITSIALTIREPVKYYATELCPKALNLAQKNISAYKLTRQIQLFQGSLLEPVEQTVTFDLVVANLPYILRADLPKLPKSVRMYEPEIALDGGPDGTKIIHEMLTQTTSRLKKRGIILLELQPKIINTVKKFAQKHYPHAKITSTHDLFDVERFLIIQT